MAVRHVGDAEKDVEQRGLAASRRAEYGDDLPILDGKIDILEHDMRAIRLFGCASIRAWDSLTVFGVVTTTEKVLSRAPVSARRDVH